MTRFLKAAAILVFGLGAGVGVGVVAGDEIAGAEPKTPGGVRAAAGPTNITPNPELLYRPVSACILADTRKAGGKFGPNTSRSFNARGNGSLAGQGGSPAGCKLPQSATVLFLNVGVIGPNAAGFIKAKPFGGAGAGAGVVNYADNQNIGGVINLPLSVSGAAKAFTLTNTGSTTDVIVTVQGYYQEPLQATLSNAGALLSGSTRVTGSSRESAGVYRVSFDRIVTRCSASASAVGSPGFANVNLGFGAGETVEVSVVDPDGQPIDHFVHLTVTC